MWTCYFVKYVQIIGSFKEELCKGPSVSKQATIGPQSNSIGEKKIKKKITILQDPYEFHRNTKNTLKWNITIKFLT